MEYERNLDVPSLTTIKTHNVQKTSGTSGLGDVENEPTAQAVIHNEINEDFLPNLTIKRFSTNDAINEIKQYQELEACNRREDPSPTFDYKKKPDKKTISKPILRPKIIKSVPKGLTIHSSVQEIQNFFKLSRTPEAILGLYPDENLGTYITNPQKNQSHPSTLEGMVSSISITKDKKILNPFFMLCEDVLNSLAEFESYMQSFSSWKDDFLKQNVTSSMKLSLALLVAKLFRAQSDLTQMVMEMVRCIKIYSQPWTGKLNAIMTLEEEHVRQKTAFEIGLRKIEALHCQLERLRASKQVFLWEYITKKLLRYQTQTEPEIETGLDSEFDSDSDAELDVEDDHDSRFDSISLSKSIETDMGAEKSKVEEQNSPLDTKVEKKNYCSVCTQTEPLRSDYDAFGPETTTSLLSPKAVLKSTKKQRLSEIKELLEFKKQSRLNSEKEAAPSVPPLYSFSKNELLEQKFNALLNERFPHLPRTVYHYLTTSRHHPTLLYPSEVVQFQASIPASSDVALPAIQTSWTTDDVPELLAPPILKSLMRCNSTNALSQLDAIMTTSVNFSDEAERTKKALEHFSKTLDEKSRPQQLQFDQLINVKQLDGPKNVLGDETKKSWFSFQDVLELSILHMQQVKQLRDEYETKLLQLRNVQIQYSIKPTLPEIQASPPLPLDKTKISSPKKQKASGTRPFKPDPPIQPEKYVKAGKAISRLPPSRPPRSIVPRNYKKSLHLPPVPRYVSTHTSLLNLNFLQRMAWMASKTRTKKNDISEKVLREQFEENLSKIIKDKSQLLSRAQVTKIMETILPAVFMPLPEKVPEYSKFPARPFSRALERVTGKISPKSISLDGQLIVYPDTRSPSPSN